MVKKEIRPDLFLISRSGKSVESTLEAWRNPIRASGLA